jgi:3-phosphoglycerate kinase
MFDFLLKKTYLITQFMVIKSIKQAKDLSGKRVLLRVDFNVPIKDGKILEEYRIIQQLPTIKYLQKQNCRIILVSHLGQPKKEDDKTKFSLKPIAFKLEELLGQEIKFVEDLEGFTAGNVISKANPKDIIMLENIRFYQGELKNSSVLAKKLAKLADIYINDAFAVSHREQATVSAIKKFLPSYAGLLLEQEVLNLSKAFNPKKPLIVIIGGVKVSTKVPLIKKLYKKAHKILVGGALSNNFLVAHGLEVGKSLIDQDSIKFAKNFKDKNIIAPIDVVVSTSQEGEKTEIKKANKVGKNDYIFDIGPETVRLFSSYINKANTIVWNGPMGMFEIKQFKHGTIAIASMVAARSKGKAFGIVGGGETVEALNMSKMTEYIDWVSTGGGAMLSYLGGEKMPGLKGIVK